MSVKDNTKTTVIGTLLFADHAKDTLEVDLSQSRIYFSAPISCALYKDDVVVLHEKLTAWLSSQE